MAKLRNPQLYQRLCQIFGRRGVHVHKAGEPGSFSVRKITGPDARYQFKRVGDEVGEQYSVRCPLCNDHQPRLHINHLWGTQDPITKKRMLWLCHCFNEECQSDYSSRIKLAELIFDDNQEVMEVDRTVEVKPDRGPVSLPGAMQDLILLAKRDKKNVAVNWCYAKGFDLHELSTLYGVGFVSRGNFNGREESRLVAPWYRRNKDTVVLGGWTARRFDDADTGKWIHGPAPTGRVVYGLAEAAKYQTIVIVEGPGDKWSVGPQAVALLGKTLTSTKASVIAEAVKTGPRRTIVILLDPAKDKVSAKHGRKHHIVKAQEALELVPNVDVLPVYLPVWSDPGGLDRDYVWRYIHRVAQAANVEVSRELIS